MKDFTATITERSPRYQEWLDVLGTNEVELKHPIPQMGQFPIGESMFYEMDVAALTGEQRERLIEHLARKFEVPETEVERDLDSVGCPLLASELIVTIHNPQKWL